MKILPPSVSVVARITLAGLSMHAAQADVWNVGGPHSSVETVADAIRMASDGDVIRVYASSTPPFAVQAKSLQILPAQAGTKIQVTGDIRISGLSAEQAVELTGFQVDQTGQTHSLFASDCAGSIRINHCEFVSHSISAPVTTATGAFFDCADVAITNSTFLGANGEHGWVAPMIGDGGDGHSALRVHGSNLALFRCSAVGGTGGDASHPGTFLPGFGGAGGHALALSGTGNIFTSLCDLQGGEGGFDDFVLSFGLGEAGDGVAHQADSAISIQVLESAISSIHHSKNSTAQSLPGQATRLSGPAWLYDDQLLSITLHGPPGARAGLYFSSTYEHEVLHFGGPLLVDVRQAPNAQLGLFLGTIDGSGRLEHSMPLSELDAFSHVKLHLVGIVSQPGGRQYTNSISPAVLDRSW